MTSSNKKHPANPAAFVCGWPVAHSRSPLVHRYWLKKYGLTGSYDKVAVEPGTLASLFDRIRSGEFSGGNITIPHKEAALKLADKADEAAIQIGAANTVWIENGKLNVTNTDWLGFIANLDDQAPGWDRPEQGGCSALVIGAGGAARGVIYGLLQRGAKSIRIVNRTAAKAEALACEFEGNLAALPLASEEVDAGHIDLVVNTSSMGMHGQPPMSDEILDLIPLLPDHAVVCDIVYTPLETPLLKTVKTHGHRTVDGLGMLLHQAAPGFEKWFGIRPEVTTELRELVIADLPQEAK